MTLVRLLLAGHQAAVLRTLPKSPLCGHTGTIKMADSYEKIFWKARCQRDNKEIQNTAWLTGEWKQKYDFF